MVKSDYKKAFTYADYLSWDDGKRWELHEGVPYLMVPAPSPEHQEISVNITRQLSNYLMGKSCKVYAAPFDVRLNPEEGDDIVCQPDIVLVCDLSKIDRRGCVGAPDMVVEILSPSTSRQDRLLKFKYYLNAGVREYWIVDPEQKTVQVCLLEDGKYIMYMHDDTAQISVHVLDSCVIDMTEVFPR